MPTLQMRSLRLKEVEMACYSPFPLPRVFCVTSLASASATTNLSPTHGHWSHLDADPLVAKSRSLLFAQEQLVRCLSWGFLRLMTTASLSEKLG